MGRLSDAGSKKKRQRGFHRTTLACGAGTHAHRLSRLAQPERHVAQNMADPGQPQRVRHARDRRKTGACIQFDGRLVLRQDIEVEPGDAISLRQKI